ncbi:MAG: hypothetical protein AB7I50_04225 [Vicinamibacterales bacterium]
MSNLRYPIPVAGLAVCIAAACSMAEGRAAESGRIAGTIVLGLKRTGRPLPLSAYGARHVAHDAAVQSESSHVLVWLKDAPRGVKPAPVAIEVRQQDETFMPHVSAIPVGSTVKFPNGDNYFHNVFSLSRTASFDLGRYPRGDSRQHTFTKPGIVKVYCHLHSHMSALIAVFDHPYFARGTEDGTFTIADVPAGRYTLTAWHERAGDTDVAVVVEPGETTRLEVVVPVIEP